MTRRVVGDFIIEDAQSLHAQGMKWMNDLADAQDEIDRLRLLLREWSILYHEPPPDSLVLATRDALHQYLERQAKAEVYERSPLVLSLREQVYVLEATLRALVEDCAPGPGEGYIPNAPSQHSYEQALTVLPGERQ